MHNLHSGLTITATIKEGMSEILLFQLSKFNELVKLKKLKELEYSSTILNMSGVIIPMQHYNKELLLPTFVLTTGYSGPLQKHLKELVGQCKKILVALFIYCDEFPDDGFITDINMLHFLRRHSRKSTFASRYNCITKNEAAQEQELRNEIEDYLDRAQKHIDMNVLKAKEVKYLIARHILTRGHEYEWAKYPSKYNLYEIIIINRAILIKTLFAAILLQQFITALLTKKFTFFKVLGLFIIVLLFISYTINKEKTIPASRPANDYLRKLAATQLRPILNEMTASAPLKGGFFRRLYFKTALRIANLLGSSVPTVSHIRWLTINQGKRLFFSSIYTNTTDFYVRDFLVGNTPHGVNFMFSHGKGFPDANILYGGGISKDPEGYMNAVHTGQIETNFWYCHEPHLPADILRRNRKLRNGLFKKMSENKADRWLKYL